MKTRRQEFKKTIRLSFSGHTKSIHWSLPILSPSVIGGQKTYKQKESKVSY